MSATSCLRCFAKNALKPSSARLGAYYSIKHFNSSAFPRKTSSLSLLSAPWKRNVPISTNPSSSRRSMFIQTESTPNDDSLKFIPGVPVMGEEGTAEFLDTRSALASPLAIRLMGVEGVSAVFYGPDFVTVSKDSENPWSIVKPEIYSLLMEHFSSGQPLFRSVEERERAGPQDTRILDTDSETVAMIKELLETRVRPAIMEDGGDIEYRGFDKDGTGLVKVKLKGSCRGCSSSTVTLKSGIERMLMHYIPEVKGVEQILDLEEEVALDEFSKLEAKLAQKESR
ncbi:HIRA-interacting protein 5 [Phlegmacium glaucopus]|nr:HIRA-interacting protein 5 [Phlegmacium glaucopus]